MDKFDLRTNLTTDMITHGHVTEPEVPYANPPLLKIGRAFFRYVFRPDFFMA